MLNQILLSRANFLHNIAQFRENLPRQTEIAGVVKANAYGHGLAEIVSCAESELDYFQIDDLVELRAIRAISKKPILLLGYVAEAELDETLQLDAELAVFDLVQLQKIAKKAQKPVKLHLAVDTRLGREGVLLEDIPAILDYMKTQENLELAGVYSHFANIEDTSDFSHANLQIEIFEQAKKLVKNVGFEVKTHISATSGIMEYELGRGGKESIARLGIGLYGLWPSPELQVKFSQKIDLKSVLTWKSHIAQVKKLPSNYPIGYGLTYITKKPTTVALIPQGYSDGLKRAFSNNGQVLIHGEVCPSLGRIAMNMCVADVSHLESVQAEDEVVLLGSQGQQNISAEKLAAQIGTINYEITTQISPLLPRLIVG